MPVDLEDKEVKEAIKKAVDEAVLDATKGLVSKNKELLSKLVKATKDSAIDPAEHQAVLEKNVDLEDQLRKSSKKVNSLQADLDSGQKILEAEKSFASELLIQTSLTKALVQGKVRPEMMPAVQALLKSKIKIDEEGGKRTASMEGKSVDDYVKEWATTDEGKNFVKPPDNSGGGAGGSGDGSGGRKSMTRAEFDRQSPAVKTKFSIDGGILTD